MARLSDVEPDPTAPGENSESSPVETAEERGRRRALDVITGSSPDPEAAADGGLHPDTVRWLAANPEADTDAALRYDQRTRPYQEATGSGDLPPRGPPGSPSNYLRSVEVNAARRAIRQYRELEARTD